MSQNRAKHIAAGITMVLLAPIVCLWSWNTLAQLFAWPQADFKHAAAALLLLLSVRWVTRSGHHDARRRVHASS